MVLLAAITKRKNVSFLRGGSLSRLLLLQLQQHPAAVVADSASFAAAALPTATASSAQGQHFFFSCSSSAVGTPNFPALPRQPPQGRSVLLSSSSSNSKTKSSNNSKGTAKMTGQEGLTQQQLQQEKALKEALRGAGISFKVGGTELLQLLLLLLLSLLCAPLNIQLSYWRWTHKHFWNVWDVAAVLLRLLSLHTGAQTLQGMYSGGVGCSCRPLGDPRVQEPLFEGQERQPVPSHGPPCNAKP